MDLDTFSRGAETVKRKTRGLIPWLPHFDCPECNRVCEADITYDPRMVERTRSWYCSHCARHFYREEPWEPDRPPGPQEGNSRLRDLFER